MLLGKRPRHLMKRTTSMTEFAPAPVEFAVTPPPPDLFSSGAAPDQRSFASASGAAAGLVSPRFMQRRFSADFDGLAGGAAAASHFLRSCSLCHRRFVPGRDIYMYRGDMAFCSLECRQQQMSQDERKERSSSAPAKKSPASSAPAATSTAKEVETLAAV